MVVEALSLSSVAVQLVIFSLLVRPSAPATDSFEYVGCTQLKYAPGTPYESNVNSVLTSLVNSASISIFNNFKVSLPGSSPDDVVYGLFQCRGDIGISECRDCVSHAVSRLGVLCTDASGGALQLEECFVKYDNTSFLGVQDKTVVLKKCGPSIGYDSDAMTHRDAALDYLAAGGQYFRVGGSGRVQGVAQCVQDLSTSECQDCLTEAIGRLKSECGSGPSGDMFLGKCYVRYTDSEQHSKTDEDDANDEDVERTLAIIIGLIAVVAVLILFLSVLSRLCEPKGCK